MTEVPEHLLRRARERRAALTGEGGGSSTPAEAEDKPAARTEAPATQAPAPAPAPAPAARAGATPAAPRPEPAQPESPVYVAARAAERTRVPVWVMPVLLVLPFWAILYAGAFGDRAHEEAVDPLTLGRQVYAANGCGSCHGSGGEGGVGPALAGGEAVKTFPEEADHSEWIRTGSAPFAGQMYGDPNREGGQRGPATGNMPGFPQLSEEELRAVVLYEREGL